MDNWQTKYHGLDKDELEKRLQSQLALLPPTEWNPDFSLSEIEELKVDLEFSQLDVRWLKEELEETKQQLASRPPAPVFDITLYDAMMQMKNQMEMLVQVNTTPLPPSNEILEIKKMVKTLVEKPDSKTVLKEILQPVTPDKKLTKKEQVALDAKALSAQRALEAIKKLKNKKP